MNEFASDFSLPPDGCQRRGHQYVQTIDDRNSLPLLVDIDEFAALLTVSPRTIYRLVAARQLPKPLKIGTLSRWPTTVVLEFIDTLRERAST